MRHRVQQIFRDHPDDYIGKLEEIGFTYCDDDVDEEEIEESVAEPENQRQVDLVAYFEGKRKPTNNFFEKFSEGSDWGRVLNYQLSASRLGLLVCCIERYPLFHPHSFCFGQFGKFACEPFMWEGR